MNEVLSKEALETVFDQVMREVTEQEAGIRLCHNDRLPSGEMYSVYIDFEKGFHSQLALCAEKSMFTRLVQNMMQEEKINAQDLEDFVKEFFNVLCGQIAARMFRETKISSRFGMPVFCHGHYRPEKLRQQFEIRYASDRDECAQLSHHTH